MIWTLAVLPVALFVLGFPVFAVLLAAAVCTVLAFMSMPPLVIHQIMYGGVDQYALLAVPFFIFAGELMGRSGIADRLIAWVQQALGHVRGSLGLTTIASSTVLGAVSGSSPATVAATGRILFPALVDNGYPRPFALGLIASSGSIAIVVPPSIAMILYGASAEQSIPKLFLAGMLPGVVIALFMGLYVIWRASASSGNVGHNINGARPNKQRKTAKADTAHTLLAIAMPVVVLAGIYLGLFSPTEAGGIACCYAILLARYVYRSMRWGDIVDAAGDAAILSAQIMIIVAAAALFSWVLTVQGIPQGLIGWVEQSALGPVGFLLAINLILLVLGCFIDPTSAILVLTPILLPIVLSLGIDPIHFGIIMTVNLSIGMFTPPFGLNIFVAQSVLQADLADLYRGILGFLLIQIAALALITYVPNLSLALVRLAYQ